MRPTTETDVRCRELWRHILASRTTPAFASLCKTNTFYFTTCLFLYQRSTAQTSDDVPSACEAGERAHFLTQFRWKTWKQLWQLQTGAMTRTTSQHTMHSYFSSVSCSMRQPKHTHDKPSHILIIMKENMIIKSLCFQCMDSSYT